MGYTGDQKREYQRKWVAARRAAWFDGKVCVVCGSSEGLELDHINPETKVSHRIWSWSSSRIEEEVAKCQVLCQDHHKVKTDEQYFSTLEPEHGTNSRYTAKKWRCRCARCRAAHAIANQSHRYGST